MSLPADGSAGRAGSGQATDRIHRAMAVALGFGALLFVGLTFGPFTAQYPYFDPVWSWLTLAGSLGTPLAAAALSRVAAVRTLRVVLGAGTLAFLVGLATLEFAVDGGTLPWDVAAPWPFGVTVIATSSAAVAFRPAIAWPYVVAVSVLVGVDRELAAPSSIIESAFQDALHNLLFTTVFAALAMAIRRAGVTLDQAADVAIAEVETTSAADARRRERERVESLVHDSVLVALLTASRSDADAAAEQARQALAAITLVADGPPAAALSARELAYRAQAVTTQIAPGARFDFTATGTELIDPEAATAGVEAMAEALRNSVRHAGTGDAEVHRAVRVHVDDMGYDIAVLDDGRGFDVDDVAPTRLGVRVGIARRMARVPGGRARIASSPGQGTRVRITWERT